MRPVRHRAGPVVEAVATGRTLLAAYSPDAPTTPMQVIPRRRTIRVNRRREATGRFLGLGALLLLGMAVALLLVALLLTYAPALVLAVVSW